MVFFLVACVMAGRAGFLGEEFWAYLFDVMVLNVAGFVFYGILVALGWVTVIL